MSSMSMWYLYILQCADNTLYTGVTTDLTRRLEEHNNSPKGAKYTKARRPVVMVYSCQYASRSEATREEWRVKKLEKSQKEELIKHATPTVT